jgi:hypothetical protein
MIGNWLYHRMAFAVLLLGAASVSGTVLAFVVRRLWSGQSVGEEKVEEPLKTDA